LLVSNTSAFQTGMSFLSVNGVQFDDPASDLSMAQYAKQTGGKWIAIVTDWFQDNINSTSIAPSRQTSNGGIIHAIKQAKRLGLKVMLKPHVDLSMDPGHWRGQIGTYFTNKEWDLWFLSYSIFIMHFVKIALNQRVDQLAVGTELTMTQGQVARWTALIQGIRLAVTGTPITLIYACNWASTPLFVPAWSGTLLDAIGVDGYFPIDDATGGWPHWTPLLADIATTYNKSIIFTEFGYCSMDDANIAPYNCTIEPLNLQEQANDYSYVYGNLSTQSWFQGTFPWAWGTDPKAGGPMDNGYTPQGKPLTLAVLSSYYAKL